MPRMCRHYSKAAHGAGDLTTSVEANDGHSYQMAHWENGRAWKKYWGCSSILNLTFLRFAWQICSASTTASQQRSTRRLPPSHLGQHSSEPKLLWLSVLMASIRQRDRGSVSELGGGPECSSHCRFPRRAPRAGCPHLPRHHRCHSREPAPSIFAGRWLS